MGSLSMSSPFIPVAADGLVGGCDPLLDNGRRPRPISLVKAVIERLVRSTRANGRRISPA